MHNNNWSSDYSFTTTFTTTATNTGTSTSTATATSTATNCLLSWRRWRRHTSCCCCLRWRRRWWWMMIMIPSSQSYDSLLCWLFARGEIKTIDIWYVLLKFRVLWRFSFSSKIWSDRQHAHYFITVKKLEIVLLDLLVIFTRVKKTQ